MASEALQVGGCEIVVDRYGKGSPLVVFHAEDGPRRAKAFLERLGARFEVHVPRLPGWPDTKRAQHVRTTRDLALVCQEYIEGLSTPVPVVGLSFGGWVAAEIAVTAPSLISSLVLVSPLGVKIGGREDRDFADLYLIPNQERLALYYSQERAPVLGDAPDHDAYLERAIGDEAMARYGWQPYMHDPGLKDRLRRVRASTLLLSGDKDRFVLNSGYYPAYSKLIPDCVHEVVAGAGHRVEEEEPQQSAERALAFLSRNR